MDCENEEFIKSTMASIAFMHFCKACHLPEMLLQLVASFFQWNDSYAEFKRCYLLNVLLARESVFCQLTYFSNKTCGNISDLEDVIDRILSFAV